MKLMINSELFAQLNQSKGFCVIYTLLLVSLSTYFFSNNSWQSITWTFPYFSGAANFETLFDWKISPSDYAEILERSATEGNTDFYYYYKHQKTDDLIENTVNNYGYLLVVFFSKTVFPYLGDLQGVVWLQLIIHTILSFFLINILFEKIIIRYGIILFYAANPLIIYFATFPFYYFWMVLPSFFFVVFVIKNDWRNWWLYAAFPFLFLSLMIRPTTLFLCGWLFVVAFGLIEKKSTRLYNLPVVVLFIGSVFFLSNLSSGSPWHTMYVGIGAYPNEVGVVDLADGRGYEFFEKKTGISIDTNPIYGNWNSKTVRNSYMSVLRERYLEIIAEKPILVLKNAILNSLQVFSIGYIVERHILTWFSTFLGFLVLTFMIYCKQFIWVCAILSSAMSFAWYFPPIPAYNFAAYLLLVMGVLFGVDKLYVIYARRISNQ